MQHFYEVSAPDAPTSNSAIMSTLSERQWYIERERIGYHPSYAEAKKMWTTR